MIWVPQPNWAMCSPKLTDHPFPLWTVSPPPPLWPDWPHCFCTCTPYSSHGYYAIEHGKCKGTKPPLEGRIKNPPPPHMNFSQPLRLGHPIIWQLNPTKLNSFLHTFQTILHSNECTLSKGLKNLYMLPHFSLAPLNIGWSYLSRMSKPQVLDLCAKTGKPLKSMSSFTSVKKAIKKKWRTPYVV